MARLVLLPKKGVVYMQELAWNLLIIHFCKTLVFDSFRTDVGAYEKIGMESLYGSEAWSLRHYLFKRLRSFHNRCARSMCSVNLIHTFRHHITPASPFRRLGILDIDSYFHNQIRLFFVFQAASAI